MVTVIPGRSRVPRQRPREVAPLEAATEQRRTLAVAVAAMFVVLVVYCLPLSILPAISDGLGAGSGAQTWLLAAVSLGMATTLLPAGALGDDFGRRRVMVGGAVLLAVASIVCALAPNPAVFLVGALGQGVGSAAMMACSLGLIAHAFPIGPARRRATGIWGASLGSGIGVGPWMAAGLEPVAGWQAAFGLAAVFALVVAVLARTLLPESRSPNPQPVDPAGMLLLGAAIGALIGGMVRGRSGWGEAPTLALLGGSVVLLALFALVESRQRAPMLDLALFRSPRFVSATLASASMGLGMIAVLSYISTAVQRGLGAGALAGAALLTVWAIASLVTSLMVARFLPNVSARDQLVVGNVVVAVALWSMWGLETGSSAMTLAAGMALSGIGSGIANAAIGGEAVAAVPAGRGSMGSGANITARYIGSTIGVSVVAPIVATHGAGAQAVTAGWNVAVLVAGSMALLGALSVALLSPRR
ncbi:MAG: MFS transporter [Sporichthyaceae bacterium]